MSSGILEAEEILQLWDKKEKIILRGTSLQRERLKSQVNRATTIGEKLYSLEGGIGGGVASTLSGEGLIDVHIRRASTFDANKEPLGHAEKNELRRENPSSKYSSHQ